MANERETVETSVTVTVVKCTDEQKELIIRILEAQIEKLSGDVLSHVKYSNPAQAKALSNELDAIEKLLNLIRWGY
jgi:hypothetical protein